MELLSDELKGMSKDKRAYDKAFDMGDGIERDVALAELDGKGISGMQAMSYNYNYVSKYENFFSEGRLKKADKEEFIRRTEGANNELKAQVWDEIQNATREEYAKDKELHNKINDMNFWTGMPGQMAGYATDWALVAGTIALSPFMAVGAAALGGGFVARVAATSIAEGLIEAPIQFQVQTSLKDLGDKEAGFARGATNVVLVAGAGGVLRSVGEVVSIPFRSKGKANLTQETSDSTAKQVHPSAKGAENQSIHYVGKKSAKAAGFPVDEDITGFGKVGNRYVYKSETGKHIYARFDRKKGTFVATEEDIITPAKLKKLGGFEKLNSQVELDAAVKRHNLSPAFRKAVRDFNAIIKDDAKWEDLQSKVYFGKVIPKKKRVDTKEEISPFLGEDFQDTPIGGNFDKNVMQAKGLISDLQSAPEDFSFWRYSKDKNIGWVKQAQDADLTHKSRGRIPIYFQNKAGKYKIVNGLQEVAQKDKTKSYNSIILRESDGWDLAKARIQSEAIEYVREAITPANIKSSNTIRLAWTLKALPKDDADKYLVSLRSELNQSEFKDIESLYLLIKDRNLSFSALALTDFDFKNNVINLARYHRDFVDLIRTHPEFKTGQTIPNSIADNVDDFRYDILRSGREATVLFPEEMGGLVGFKTARALTDYGVKNAEKRMKALRDLFRNNDPEFLNTLLEVNWYKGKSRVLKTIEPLYKNKNITEQEVNNIRDSVRKDVELFENKMEEGKVSIKDVDEDFNAIRDDGADDTRIQEKIKKLMSDIRTRCGI